MAWWHIPVYLVDLASMVLLSFFLGDLVDTLDKKTKISGAFIGGVLLAAVTSLPELFTSLSSIFFVNEPEYVVGDILGSIIFDLVCLALETFLFLKNFRNAKIQKFHLFNGIACILMYVFAAYGFFAPTKWQLMLGDINAMPILIFLLYILTLVLQPKEKEEDVPSSAPQAQKGLITWSLLKIWIAFTIASLLLIGTSIALTYLTKFLQNDFPEFLSGSVAGALLLGIGTSIPEIISNAQLFRRKNYDAGFGNMIGFCTFDFAIFAFADFLSWRQWNNKMNAQGGYIISERGLFIASPDAIQFELFGLGVCATFILFILLKIYTKVFENEKTKWLAYSATGLWAAACTTMYLLIFIL